MKIPSFIFYTFAILRLFCLSRFYIIWKMSRIYCARVREMKKVYIELVLLDNFLMDFIILFFAMRLCEKRAKLSRVCAGAGIGAAYSVVALAVPFLGGLVWKGLALLAMCLPLGVRPAKRYFSRCGLALTCSFLFGGCIFFAMLATGAPLNGAYLGLPILRYVLAGVAAGIALLELCHRTPSLEPGEEYLIHAEFSGFFLNLKGFLDTGNLLISPGGQGVIIVNRAAVEASFLSFLESRPLPNFSCITASGKSELPAFLPDKLIITAKSKSYAAKAYLALSDAPFPSGYSALLGPKIKLFPL